MAKEQEKSIFEMLTDDDNCDNIVLTDEDGNEQEFEQIAVIPYEEELYCILHPLNDPEVAEDEAIVFLYSEDDEGEILTVVEDDELADKIFELYDELE